MTAPAPSASHAARPSGLVVIGASWGGLHAVGRVLATLPPTMRLPILVVQHRARDGDGLLTSLLQGVTARPVRDAVEGEPLMIDHVRVAPPDQHLVVRDGALLLSREPAVRYSRPSIDVTLTAAGDAYGACAIAVVLTGANNDGARGARHVAECGGAVVVQTPETAEVRTMPEAALRQLATIPARQWASVPLDGIADAITRFAAPLQEGIAFDSPSALPAPRPRRHRSLQ